MGPAVPLAGRALVVLLLSAAVFLLGAPAAGAHADLVSTTPRDGDVLDTVPDRVELGFSEPVSLRVRAVQLFDAAGAAVPVEPSSRDTAVSVPLPRDLAEGTYVLSWRVVSADSHPVAGGLTFSIGRPSAQVAAVSVARGDPLVETLHAFAQALTYLGLLVAAGLVAFELLVLRGPTGGARARRRVVLAAALAGGVGGLVLVPLGGLRLAGAGPASLLDPDSWSDQLLAGPGLAAALSVAGLSVAVGLTPRARGRALPTGAALGAAALALGSLALVGHTRTFGPGWLVPATDLVHVTAAAGWLGGLIGLGTVLAATGATRPARAALPLVVPAGVLPTPTTTRAPTPPRRQWADGPAEAAVVLARFSALAAVLVVALAAAGALLGWRVLGSLAALTGTGYGRTLLVKVGLVAVVLALAVLNRYRLLPRVARVPDDGRAWAALRRSVRLEAAVLVAAVAVTGVLVGQSPVPPPDPGATPVGGRTASGALGEGTVQARLTPGTVGVSSLELILTDGEGLPVEPLEEPRLSMSLPAVGLGPLERPVVRTGPGTYEATVDLPLAGEWEMQVSARTSRFENPVAVVPVEVR